MGWVGARLRHTDDLGYQVSIPERVWGGLEPGIPATPRIGGAVSIPERVWGGLEPVPLMVRVSTAIRFQSLRGFGVGWSI